MISGIGSSYNNYYSYQNTINQMRLQQALSKNPNYQKQIEASQPDYSERYRSSSLDFLRDYSSTMSDVMQSANSLRDANSAGVMNTLTVTSSDTAVADVSNRYKIRQEGEMSLDVTQLAAAQQNRSQGVSSGADAKEDMSFAITGQNGRFDFNVSALNENGTAKTNTQMLREAASAINKSDAGVLATVTQEDGKVVLSLQSRNTGTNAAFEVSGQLGAAQGLQDVSTEAANAQYSVTKNGRTQDYTSQSNSVQLDAGRIQADLKQTGTTVISAGPDAEKVANAVSDLLADYNKAVSFLESNESHGRGTAKQLDKFQRSVLSDESLSKLGISVDKEGQLVLDKEALTKALKEEPTLTKELLSGSNGLAQNLYNKGVSAMSANSASLISSDLQSINNDMMMDPFQYMNLYSRSGAYTMNNYATLGLMMNYLV